MLDPALISAAPAADAICRNCGVTASGDYCPGCGQETQLKLPTLPVRYGPYAMFLLLPAVALLLKALYFGRHKSYPARPKLYGQHLVFSAHNHAALFLFGLALLVVPGRALSIMIAAWAAIYGLCSLRVVYGGPWLGIVARSFLLAVSYLVLFAGATAGLLMAAVLLRRCCRLGS